MTIGWAKERLQQNGLLSILAVLLIHMSPLAAQDVFAQGAVPVFSETGPDAEGYGEGLGYPIGLPFKRQQSIVGNYSHYDRLFPSHVIAAPAQQFRLARATNELAVTYSFRGETQTLQNYLARNPTTGLLIARGDTILFEHYQYGRTDHDRFTSKSMAKTVTAMLIGIAISEGAIRSVDDPAEAYVRELTGTELGRTPIRALLHMASGIQYSESYDGTDDDAMLNRALYAKSGPGPIAAVSQFNTRIAPPDTHWSYASLNSEVLGLVVTHATHSTLAQYLQTRIWQPMGAEADASWGVDYSGQEIAYCCFNATLRDYARFGLLLAHDGELNGKQIIPRQWIIDGTEPITKGSYLAVENNRDHPWGYGYQVWLMPGPRRMFVLEGIEGQRIFVDPESKLVMVHTSVRRRPTHDPGDVELIYLWRSILDQANPK